MLDQDHKLCLLEIFRHCIGTLRFLFFSLKQLVVFAGAVFALGILAITLGHWSNIGSFPLWEFSKGLLMAVREGGGTWNRFRIIDCLCMYNTA